MGVHRMGRHRSGGASRWSIVVAILVSGTVFVAGCASSKEHERGSEDPNLDERAMSLRLDNNDLAHMFDENFKKLLESDTVAEWEERTRESSAPVVATFPIRNETSEHIRKPLDTFLGKFEGALVEHTPAEVVDRERREKLVREVRRQKSASFDASKLADYGERLGAQYYLTGKAYDVAERTEDARRVQYFLFLQVLNVETGEIEFQAETKVTKALVS